MVTPRGRRGGSARSWTGRLERGRGHEEREPEEREERDERKERERDRCGIPRCAAGGDLEREEREERHGLQAQPAMTLNVKSVIGTDGAAQHVHGLQAQEAVSLSINGYGRSDDDVDVD